MQLGNWCLRLYARLCRRRLQRGHLSEGLQRTRRLRRGHAAARHRSARLRHERDRRDGLLEGWLPLRSWLDGPRLRAPRLPAWVPWPRHLRQRHLRLRERLRRRRLRRAVLPLALPQRRCVRGRRPARRVLPMPAQLWRARLLNRALPGGRGLNRSLGDPLRRVGSAAGGWRRGDASCRASDDAHSGAAAGCRRRLRRGLQRARLLRLAHGPVHVPARLGWPHVPGVSVPWRLPRQRRLRGRRVPVPSRPHGRRLRR